MTKKVKAVKAWAVLDSVGYLICAYTVKKYAEEIANEFEGRTIKECEIKEVKK